MMKYFIMNLVLVFIFTWVFMELLGWSKFGGIMSAGLSSGIVLALIDNEFKKLKGNETN